MAKPPKEPKRDQPEVDLVDDAWPKFQQFIRDVSKAGPQHRKTKPTKKAVRKK